MGNKTFTIKDLSKFNRQLGPREKIICLLGETGNGKSTFINQITKKNECKEGDDTEAVTTEPKMVSYDYEGYNFYFIDTPGLNDKKGDDENLKQLNSLRKCPRLNAFILLLKFNDLRITESMQRSLIEFMKIFPSKNFWDNVIIVRNWSFEDIKRGKILEGIKNDKKLAEFMKNNNINLYVNEEERFEETQDGCLENFIIKTTTYVDFDNQRRSFTEKIMKVIYNLGNINPSLVTVKRVKTGVVQTDCCCKKYQYEYRLILKYEIKGKIYNKTKVLETTFEDENNDVEGENYRKKKEDEQNKIYKKL